ncbi:cytospin-A isoform X2 [Sitodiplosis mosellana]|nr:cytospin-A isoform X2 [Sitodiplosis mosellana]XP_055319283.1 cytospin-A isoform X2 [Sitodiplosis mosellana]XP_055319284.1 cytospin-A isoform X2 [Sitodiplosis mosellana]XP_055319285.1 cytospin-A isoform X2 [Sitodiplosis mosellana]XP_055319286.1 cytospin-A isoform X2 [Sitodiplosis mosellana]
MTEHSPDKLIIGSTTTVATTGANSNTTTGIGKVVAGELKDSDTEIGPDDGCGSCYSSSMRDLLSDELPEDTFNGHDEIQQHQIIHELQENLEQVTRDKMALEAKIMEMSSYKSEMLMLQSEIVKLQVNYDKAIRESQQLIEENESLRNRLRDVVNSPLSDAEKQQIIDDSQHRLHSSAPASIALPNNDGEGSSCITTPDWDKHSSSSEVSVACLQDKIIQMEETHYSTNEELQATLQELADLQSQLTELQTDNDRLIDEKEVLFQSLCRQTEKLELLLRESDQQDAVMTTEREQKLLDLLKSAQEERESMFIKHEELQSDIKEMRTALEAAAAEKLRLIERIGLLESTLDASAAERKQTDAELSQAREEGSQRQIEISRLSTLLENARSKIDEFEQERAGGDKSDLSELLDVARKEKDLLESEMTVLQESLSKSQCEVQKLKDQIAAVTEECKVTRNNAKCALSDLEYKFEQLKQEKTKLSFELQAAQENLTELQVQCKCHLEDKAQLESLLSETQRHLGETERILSEKEDALNNERKLRKFENEEWKQFQSDLLMTVRVANDFKTEAQTAHEQLVIDNKTQKERIRTLEQENLRLSKAVAAQESQTSLLSTVMQQEMAQRRQRAGISRQDSRLSVKSLIESIEKTSTHVKSNGQTGDSHSSSSSINSLMSDAPILQTSTRNATSEWSSDSSNMIVDQSKLHASLTSNRSPLLEKQSPNFNCDGNHNNSTHINNNNNHGNNTISKVNSGSAIESTQTINTSNNLDANQKYGFIMGERKDPLSALVKNGGSKRNALLKWCQNKTVGYRNIDITNFSSSWNDGLAFCAILHSYLKDKIPYDTLGPHDKRRNFTIAFQAAESVGIHTTLNINNMCQQERPDWMQVLAYVTAIYKHFET